MSENEPAPSPEGRELLALIQRHGNAPTLRMMPGLSATLAAVAAYVQRSELRMFALEKSAQAMAEQILVNHYGGGREMPCDRLREIATAARDEETLRALRVPKP